MNSSTPISFVPRGQKIFLHGRWLCMVMVAVVSLLALGLPEAKADKNWDAGGGQANTSWTTSTNWSPDAVPSGESAYIPGLSTTADYTAVLSTTAPNISSLFVGWGGGYGNAFHYPTLTINDGGSLTTTGSTNFGVARGSPTITLNGTASLYVGTSTSFGNEGNFGDGQSTLNVNDTASYSTTSMMMAMRGNTTTINQAGGTVTVRGTGDVTMALANHATIVGTYGTRAYYNISSGTFNVGGTLIMARNLTPNTSAFEPQALAEVTQTGGTVNMGVGTTIATTVLSIGHNATNFRGTNNATYKLYSGTLDVKGHVALGQATNTNSTHSGYGTIELGNASGTGTFQQNGGTGGTARDITIRSSAYSDGTLTGWGTVAFTGTLTNNGRVIANGFDTARSLDLSNFTAIDSTIENGTGASTNKDISGWYAINKGKLILPDVIVDSSAGTYTYNLGESSSDTTIDLVNSVRITLTKAATTAALLGDTNGDGVVDVADFNNVQNNFGATGPSVLGDTNGDGVVNVTDFNNVQNNFGAIAAAGTPKINYSLYHRNHTAIPILPGDAKIASLWDITPTFTISTADMTFRYDDALAATLGITESNLKLYRYNTAISDWEQVTSASLDTANNRITATGVTRFGLFAVGTMTVGGTTTQVDLSINSASDSNYYIDNTYQTTPSGSQIQTAHRDRTTLWTWNVRVQNDGNAAQTYILKATGITGSGWTVTYKYNSTNIGTDILGSSGWTTPSIAVGAYITVNVEVTADATVAYGATKDVVVSAGYISGSYIVQDSVKGTYQVNTPTVPQADLSINSASDSNYYLDNTYQTTPAGPQVQVASKDRTTLWAWNVRVQNDGNAAQTYILKATGTTGSGWTVTYKYNSTNIGTDILGSSGWTTPSIAVGAYITVNVEVTADATVAYGATKDVVVSAGYISGSYIVQDSVKGTYQVNTPPATLADLTINSESDSNYYIDNTYQTTPSGSQIQTAHRDRTTMWTWNVRVQNDGTAAQTYILKATGTTGSGWTVTYKYNSTNISTDILGSSGWTTPTIAVGAYVTINVEVTPDGTVAYGATKEVVVSAGYVSGSYIVQDSVKGIYQVNTPIFPQADLSINSEFDSNYYLDNTYQTTPSGNQAQVAHKDRTTLWTWNVRVQNDGNAARTYVLKATGTSGSGWTVTYKYNSTNIGTSILGSSGWTTPSIAVGAYITVNVEVTADATVAYGATKDVVVSAGYVSGSYIVQDSVKGTYQVNNPASNYDLITNYGGNLFYETYWGNLTVTPLGNGTSRITRSGGEPFTSAYVGKMFESARIHKNPSTYPSTGANYIPMAVTVRYATVTAVESATSLIVDFEYNGGNATTPQATANTDGIFFYNNRTALQNWANSPTRKAEVRWDGVLAILGFPNITVSSNMSFRDSSGGKENIYIKLMYSDDFNVSQGGSYGCPTWTTQYGSGAGMFKFGSGQVNIDLPQILPTIYMTPSYQYVSAIGSVFSDTAGTASTATGLKKTYNWQQYKERDEMIAALGSARPGANFMLPGIGYCVGGGTHNGTDITAMNIYEIDGGWVSPGPMNLKAKFKSGILFWVHGNETQRADFIEKPSFFMTGSNFPNIQTKFTDNRTCVVNDDLFTFYHMVNQYWLGGLGNSGLSYNQVKVMINGQPYTLYLGSLGDWWHELKSTATPSVILNAQTCKMFDRIPVANNVITLGAGNLGAFASSNVIRVWGWAMVPGTQLRISGVNYSVTAVSRTSTTSGTYGGANITYFNCTLSGTPTQSTTATVVSSPFSQLLDGNYRSATHYLDRDMSAHLCYTDQETNMRWENVNYCGLVRATGEYDGSNDLYKMTSIAEFTNVFCINEDGTPKYSEGSEYNPESLRRRQQLTGNNNYRVKISGGRFFWRRGGDNLPEVIFTNRPHLIYGSASFGEPRLWNPIMGDTQGLIIGSSDGTSAPFDSIGCSIVLSGGASLNLSNSELRGQLFIAGHGSVNLSNITSVTTPGSTANYYGVEIVGSVNSVATPTVWNLAFTGSGGQCGFRQSYTYAIGNLSFNLTNWTLRSTYNAGDGFTTAQNPSNANYCNYISINGQCLN